jgi:hypothetical protein
LTVLRQRTSVTSESNRKLSYLIHTSSDVVITPRSHKQGIRA